MITYFYPTEFIPEYDLEDFKIENGDLKYCNPINIPDNCPHCKVQFVIVQDGSSSRETEFDNYCEHILTFYKIWDMRIKASVSIDEINDGCKCDSCTEWVPMANPNMPNNKFRCYRCRNHPLLTY